MKLPFAEVVRIDPRKLRDYALSSEHPSGRFKAVFFATLGFTRGNWEKLDLELRRLALQSTAELGERNGFGQKYVIRGRITGPTGRSAEVVVVWIVLEGEGVPRLVTVYPGVAAP